MTRLASLLILISTLAIPGCREHQVVEVKIDPLAPMPGELVYMIIGQDGDTSYRRELGLILRDSNSVVLRNELLNSTDMLKIVVMQDGLSQFVGPHEVLFQHYGLYYSNNGMSKGSLTLRETDDLGYSASGDFEFRLGNGATGDSITIIGSFKSLDYLDMTLRPAPVTTIDSISIEGFHVGYHFLSNDSLTFTGWNFDEDPATPHTIWYNAIVHQPKVGLHDLGDATLARVEIHRYSSFGGTDQYSESIYSGIGDVLQITEFDRDKRELSGNFIVAGRRGAFKDVSWNMIGYR